MSEMAKFQATMTTAATVPSDPAVMAAAEANVAAEWKTGDVILDMYEVKDIHEGGGMGLVYRAYHRGWNLDLAIKSPRGGYFQTETQKENFTRECEAWINLGLHPHIVSCYYVRTLGGIPRVFAEYVEGGSLKDWIDSRKLYRGSPNEALERIVDIAIQCAWGLAYAHEQNLIHQDVKPANVLLSPEGEAKISDFGLAKARTAAGESLPAGAGRSTLVTAGGMTPAYCSPEQANQRPLSRKTDIWSWAVSVLEMLVGEVCWQSGVAAPQVLAQLDELRVEGAGIPEPPSELVQLLEQCFAEELAIRPESFDVVAERLKSFYHGIAGREYVRQLAATASLRADALNNRAVSLLDLGRADAAEKLFEEALALEPGHPQTIYNRGLQLWRNGRETDVGVLKGLEQSRLNRPDDWQVPYLVGCVHMERHDVEATVEAFSAAEVLGGGVEVQQALAKAKCLKTGSVKSISSFAAHSVTSLALSTDGCWAMSASEDNILRLWEVSSGQCVRTFKGHRSGVSSVALSADGRWALSGSWDATLRLWEVSSDRCLTMPVRFVFGVTCVALSADGRWALSGSEAISESGITTGRGDLRLWELSSGNCVRTLEGHQYRVASVALTGDGRWALSASWDKTLRLWDLTSGECLRTFEGHTNFVDFVALSADGRLALSGSRDKNLRLWDMTSGKCLKTLEGHTDSVSCAVLSADGCWALSEGNDKTLRLWDLTSGKCLRTFDANKYRIATVALTKDGYWPLWASSDAAIRLRALKPFSDENQAIKAQLAVCRLTGTSQTLGLQTRFQALLSDGKTALGRKEFGRAWRFARDAQSVAGYEFSAEALELAYQAGSHGVRKGLRRGWCRRAFEKDSGLVGFFALSGDGRWVLSRSGGDTLLLWELSSGDCIRTFNTPPGGVYSFALSADRRWALSGSRAFSDSGVVRLWEVSSGQCVRTLKGHTDWVTCVALSADGRWALSGSTDTTLRLWELSSGRCLRTFEGHADAVSCVALSADRIWALSGSATLSDSGDLRLWELRSGKCLRTFDGHTGAVKSVALSADGRWALSGGDVTLRLWEVGSGKCVRTFEGHTGRVNSVALSADGRWALSGSSDKTLRLWELSSGQCLRTFEGHTTSVTTVALTPDGRWALSESGENSLRLWELDWDHEFPEPQDWDEGAKPYLDAFLTLHCRLTKNGVTRVGKPEWTDEEFEKLLVDLKNRGYGWLRPEGVRRKLAQMAAERSSWLSRFFGGKQ